MHGHYAHNQSFPIFWKPLILLHTSLYTQSSYSFAVHAATLLKDLDPKHLQVIITSCSLIPPWIMSRLKYCDSSITFSLVCALRKSIPLRRLCIQTARKHLARWGVQLSCRPLGCYPSWTVICFSAVCRTDRHKRSSWCPVFKPPCEIIHFFRFMIRAPFSSEQEFHLLYLYLVHLVDT